MFLQNYVRKVLDRSTTQSLSDWNESDWNEKTINKYLYEINLYVFVENAFIGFLVHNIMEDERVIVVLPQLLTYGLVKGGARPSYNLVDCSMLTTKGLKTISLLGPVSSLVLDVS